MTWTFLNAPDTTTAQGRLDFVRVLIQDTDDTNELQTDEALNAFLTMHGNNVLRAAAMACRVLAAGSGDSTTVGDLSITGAGASYRDMAADFDRQADMQATPFAGGISQSDKDSRAQDSDRVAPAFSRGLHETPGRESQVSST